MLYCDENYWCGYNSMPYGDDRLLVESGLSGLYNVLITSPTRVSYTSSDLIVARIGGMTSKLIPMTDDSRAGSLDSTILDNIISNVTTEIDSYLATCYPIPFVRRDTVALVKVTEVDTDGAITEIEIYKPADVEFSGYYYTAPATSENALVYAFPLQTFTCWQNWPLASLPHQGTGAEVSCTFSASRPYSLTAVPTITEAGEDYAVGDILALTGGASYVPLKVQNAALELACESLYTRRLAPPEQNLFNEQAKKWRKELLAIGHGELELDAMFPRLFTPGAAWVTRSRLNSNSL